MRISDWSSDVCSSDLPHSCAQISQAWIHNSSVERSSISFDPVRLVPTLNAISQTSAQSRQTLMHWRKSATLSSAMQASAQLVQISEQNIIDRKSTRLNSSH